MFPLLLDQPEDGQKGPNHGRESNINYDNACQLTTNAFYRITSMLYNAWKIREKIRFLLFFLGGSLTSEFYMRTFRNNLSIPSSLAV